MLRALRRIAPLAVGFVLAACGSSPSGEDVGTLDPALAGGASPDSSPRPHSFDVGVSEWTSEFAPFAAFRAVSGATGPRLCHAYTFWDIAHRDPPSGDETHTLHGLEGWFAIAATACDEVLVTFQGPQIQGGSEAPPSVAAFESAFVAFLHLTDPGQPLHAWSGRLAFTPWNEPNNQANSGNGLQESISPELAAHYYMAARAHCAPSAGCKVAAGDLATNGNTANDIEWNCADDNTSADTPQHCAAPSRFNTTGKAPSYLDRYKNEIAAHSGAFGLPAGFRPEYFAYHPWHDVNSYIESNATCDAYGDCVTRRLLQSLGGTWSGSEIWDTEIGVGLQTSPAPDEWTTQPCGAAFLVQLTDLSPRITRLYYMRFAGGNGPLFDGSSLRSAGQVLAGGALTYQGARCHDTGLLATYTNPIIPMFRLTASDSSSPSALPSEGCPDPTGIKTSSGDYYVYCTSYTSPYSRYDGFPIFRASSLAGPWTRAGSIIEDSGPGRSSWPKWIHDQNGKRYGEFWAPDVHELPSGKFVATYAAPCGGVQCVGVAWSDHPAGPWTHAGAPLITTANNGAGWGTTYDPNLLVTSDGHLYLYWAVGGAGLYGAEVGAAASGQLGFASAPAKLASWGAAGAEGPYVIERGSTYYLFYSNDPDGGILYNYQVHVLRSSSPLGGFDQEGPLVVHKSNVANGGSVSTKAFVATGGNSVIQDAADGVDFLVYHAIVVPEGNACPGTDPTSGSAVHRDAQNPYCRVQGERQAMLDPITWKPDGSGGEWPTVYDGTPSTWAVMVP
jgi:Glycosyl hydrolases family 43